MTVLVFGQLEDITGSSVITLGKVADTELLLSALHAQYPAMKQKKMLIAVDQKIIYEKTEIGEQAQVALLPPFSGG